MTEHDRCRMNKALRANRSDREELIEAIGALQSTDDPSLVPLYNELCDELAAMDKREKEKTMLKAKNLKPQGDRILIQIEETPEKTPSGILLPDSAREAPTIGLIIAIGPGRRNEQGLRVQMDSEVGQRVMFSRYSGIKIPGLEDHLFVREEEIIAVIER